MSIRSTRRPRAWRGREKVDDRGLILGDHGLPGRALPKMLPVRFASERPFLPVAEAAREIDLNKGTSRKSRNIPEKWGRNPGSRPRAQLAARRQQESCTVRRYGSPGGSAIPCHGRTHLRPRRCRGDKARRREAVSRLRVLRQGRPSCARSRAPGRGRSARSRQGARRVTGAIRVDVGSERHVAWVRAIRTVPTWPLCHGNRSVLESTATR